MRSRGRGAEACGTGALSSCFEFSFAMDLDRIVTDRYLVMLPTSNTPRRWKSTQASAWPRPILGRQNERNRHVA